MSSDHIKKQLESNLVPNGWRIFKSLREKRGPVVLTSGALVKAALIAGGVLFAFGKLLWLPKSPAVLLIIYVVAVGLALGIVGRTGTPEREFDAFGNEIDESNIYGSGRRMTDEEKRRFLEIFPQGSPKGTILGYDPEIGMALGIPDVDRPFHEDLDHKHILLFGATGRGKTKFLKDRHRQLILQGFSDFYTDPKGELTEDVVYPCADAMGYKNKILFRFRTSDIHLSNRFDLLKSIRNAEYPAIVANSLANMILGFKKDAKKTDYWEDSAVSLLTLSILAAARCEDYIPIEVFLSTGDEAFMPGAKGTWKTASSVFAYSAEEVEAYFKYLMSISKYNEKLLRRHFNNWVGDERNYKGHVSSVGKKIQVLAEEGVAEVFSEDEVDFDVLVNEPSTLGLIYSPGDEGYFSAAMNLVIQMIVSAILRNEKSSQRRAILLEELKVTGVIDRLDEHFSFLRSYKTQIIGCTQAYSQLEDLYGEKGADSFFQNTHIVFAGGQQTSTLERLERLTGTQGIKKMFSSTSVGGGSVRTTEGEDVVGAPVVDRTELLYMPKGRLFIKLSNCGPAILDSYDSSQHPLADVKYVDVATGKPHELSLEELLPGFNPEEAGLKIVGAPRYSKREERDYDDYLTED